LSARTDARIALAALGVRVASAVLALLVLVAFGTERPVPAASTMWGRASPFWDAFVRHDSGWYLDIARRGYEFSDAVAGGRGNIAYAPVYPLLMRYVGRGFGRSPGQVYLGGILVSWTAFIVAMLVLYRLAALDLPHGDREPVDRAARAVLLTAIFPFSFFFGAVYSESTFLLFTLLAFYGFRTRRWAVGGLFGALAGATRVTGILMWPALAWTAWQALRGAEHEVAAHDRGDSAVGGPPGTGAAARERALAAVALAAATLGFAGYCLYVYQQSGDPLLWAKALTRWGTGYRPGGAPWSAPLALAMALLTHPYVFLTSGPMAVYDALYGVTAIAFAVATLFVWRRFGAGYGLFMALNLYVPLSSGAFEGLGRYCSVLFPCFIWLASIRSERIFLGLVIACSMLYTLGLAMFVTLRPLF
jgi:mannosyltransferase PIG-V